MAVKNVLLRTAYTGTPSRRRFSSRDTHSYIKSESRQQWLGRSRSLSFTTRWFTHLAPPLPRTPCDNPQWDQSSNRPIAHGWEAGCPVVLAQDASAFVLSRRNIAGLLRFVGSNSLVKLRRIEAQQNKRLAWHQDKIENRTGLTTVAEVDRMTRVLHDGAV